MIAERENKEHIKEKKKADRAFKKLWVMEKKDVHTKRVAARKDKRSRVWKLKELSKQGITLPSDSELLVPIHDPEAQWKATDPIWLAHVASKNKKHGTEGVDDDNDEEETTFIIDTEGDPTLQRDFIPFGAESDSGGSKFGYNVDDKSDENTSDENVQERLGW